MAVKKDAKSGKWYFYGKHKDRTNYKRRGFDTKKEALIAEMKYLEEYETEQADRLEREKVEVPFELLVEEYMEWYEARRKYSSTYKVRSVINNHILPIYQGKFVSDITASDIMDHQTKLINRGYSGSHCEKVHTVTSSIFKFAIRKEYIKENPASIAGGPDIKKNKPMEYWTLEEFKEFIVHVDDEMYYALFMTLYYSGMRKGELLALTWADIDFLNNTINIDKTEYKRVIQTPKTESSIRKIYMPKHVMRLLDALKTKRKAKQNYAVFGEFTTSVSETGLTKRYDRYVKKSGVKRIRLHDFRHSHASYLINKGIIISVVAARLGHGNVATTLNIYSHLFPSTEKEAVLTMENDFKPAQIIQLKTKQN